MPKWSWLSTIGWPERPAVEGGRAVVHTNGCCCGPGEDRAADRMVREREAGAGDACCPLGGDRERVVAVHEVFDQPDQRAVVAGANAPVTSLSPSLTVTSSVATLRGTATLTRASPPDT